MEYEKCYLRCQSTLLCLGRKMQFKEWISPFITQNLDSLLVRIYFFFQAWMQHAVMQFKICQIQISCNFGLLLVESQNFINTPHAALMLIKQGHSGSLIQAGAHAQLKSFTEVKIIFSISLPPSGCHQITGEALSLEYRDQREMYQETQHILGN